MDLVHSQEKCAICLEENLNMTNKTTLQCQHEFHKTCINQYYGTSCPICKKEFITSNIYYINKNTNNNFSNVILLKNNLFRTINRFFTLDKSIIFLNLLNSKMVLSGQILLSIIQNTEENMQLNTLDIYIDNYFHYKTMSEFLKKNNYQKQNEPTLINYLSIFSSYQSMLINNGISELIIDESIIYKINKYTNGDLNINIIFNVNNLYTIENRFKLDILKNYFDGNYFYVYNITKLELKIEYIYKERVDNRLKDIISYYRNNNYNIYITEN